MESPLMRGLVSVISVGLLTFLLVVLSGENRPKTVRAGIAHSIGIGKLYILSIGINAYPTTSGFPILKFAVADAQGVASAFSTKEVGDAFDGIEVATLFDSDATLVGVRKAIDHLITKCDPDDVVLFYFAGMGDISTGHNVDGSTERSTGDYNFDLVDSTKGSTNTLTARELSSLLLSIQARRQIIILDSEESSLAFESLRNALNADSIFTLRETGRRFALLGVDGASNETVELGHGLLTYALLEAMRGAADTNHDGVITEAELEGYLMSRIQDLVISKKQPNEQLLSYSDLRGLCLFSGKTSSSCDRTYGYDPLVKTTQRMRGVEPDKPSVAEQAKSRGTDYALILAGDKYDYWPELKNPEYDAQTLQRELMQNFGYSKENVTYEANPTKRRILDLLTDFHARSFGENDRLLIYIAGHGFVDHLGEGYLVTRESMLPEEDPYLGSGLNFSRFESAVDGLKIPHILVVLDVCYGGYFKDHKLLPAYTVENLDSPQSVDDEILNKMKSMSRLYIASGGLRQTYDGEAGKHSPFARAFLKTLRQYGGKEQLIDMGKLDGAVEGLCPHPYYGTFGQQQAGGDFIFVPKPDPQKVADPGLDAKVEGPHCSP